jgi:hypothetical protein
MISTFEEIELFAEDIERNYESEEGRRGKYNTVLKGRLDDQETGLGILEKPREFRYCGELERGCKHGKGVLLVNGKYRYVGFFKNDQRDGDGICSYFKPTDYRITGLWEKNEINSKFAVVLVADKVIKMFAPATGEGFGEIYRTTNGERYCHAFRKERLEYKGGIKGYFRKHGRGVYYERNTNEDGSESVVEYDTEFIKDEMMGNSRITGPNWLYEGTVAECKFHGEGILFSMVNTGNCSITADSALIYNGRKYSIGNNGIVEVPESSKLKIVKPRVFSRELVRIPDWKPAINEEIVTYRGIEYFIQENFEVDIEEHTYFIQGQDVYQCNLIECKNLPFGIAENKAILNNKEYHILSNQVIIKNKTYFVEPLKVYRMRSQGEFISNNLTKSSFAVNPRQLAPLPTKLNKSNISNKESREKRGSDESKSLNSPIQYSLGNNLFYAGSVRNFKANGKGTVFFSDDRVFTGNFKNNMIQGSGEVRYPNGAVFKGEFENNKRHGHGVLSGNGEKTSGVWINGKINGNITMEMKNGDSYEGEIENELFHGFGKYVWGDNRVEYLGEFSCGKIEGRGKMVINGVQDYEGEWKNGTFHGNGKIIMIEEGSSEVYEGGFFQGKYHGKGIYINKDGEKYELESNNGEIIRRVRLNI